MSQRAIVRSSAGDVLVWLEEHATVLLVAPPPRDGPAAEAGFG
jgi:hypothetical protein